MSWTVEYVPEKDMVKVFARGRIFNQDARDQAVEVINLLKQRDANFILVDSSDVKLEVSLANLYWLPEYYLELGAPQHVRVAIVLPRSHGQIESYQFYQIACKNAGYNVKLFESEEAAEDWFRQVRPSRPAERYAR